MGAFTMGFRRLFLVTAIARDLPDCLGTVAHLRRREDPERGRNPRLGYCDQSDGKGTPAGQGTAKEGAELYVRKGCAGCHGATGSGGQAPTLISRKGAQTASSMPSMPCLAPCVNDANIMALHSPFATTIWDYINRGMPLGKEGTLKPNEVYALTAFLLYKNDVIKEDEVMDAQSLPKVKMPNRDGFALPPEWKHGTPRLQGYP